MWTDELEHWLSYYDRKGSSRSRPAPQSFGEQPPGGRVAAFQANSGPRENSGAQLLRILDAAELDDEALLAGRFRLIDHALRQEATYRDGAYTIELTGVSVMGAPLNVRVEAEAIHVLPRLDGSATLDEVVDRAARETGLDRSEIEEAALTTIRRLYGRGFALREP